jgi:hypothetical protein
LSGLRSLLLQELSEVSDFIEGVFREFFHQGQPLGTDPDGFAGGGDEMDLISMAA